MQLVLINNRIVAHGEGFIALGGIVINTETGKKYEHATIAECSGCPSDIDTVGYEYRAGVFTPCAPYGIGKGNVAVLCNNDCKSIKDSEVSIDTVCAMSSYMSFVGNVNADMVSAAFGKGNEDEIAGIGKALVMYSHFKGEDIDFSVLQNYDSLKAISKSQEAISEVLGSSELVTLMQSNEYSKQFIELWRLNAALPESYRRNSFEDIVQDVQVMQYMYDNYATFEALNVLSYSSFVNAARQYATITDTVTCSAKEGDNRKALYNKKCFVVDVVIIEGKQTHNSGQYMVFTYRPNGVSPVERINSYDLSYGQPATFNVCKFASSLGATWDVSDTPNSDGGDTVYALVIPCE